MTTPIAFAFGKSQPGRRAGRLYRHQRAPTCGITAAATNIANDESPLSDEDISARRMAHAAAAAVAAAAQQAQWRSMSVAGDGCSPGNPTSTAVVLVATSRFRTIRNTNNQCRSPQNSTKEYVRRQAQMENDARANEKILALNEK